MPDVTVTIPHAIITDATIAANDAAHALRSQAGKMRIMASNSPDKDVKVNLIRAATDCDERAEAFEKLIRQINRQYEAAKLARDRGGIEA